MPAAYGADHRQGHIRHGRHQFNDQAADHVGQASAQIHTHGIGAQRATQLIGRKVIRDHGVGCGRQRSLTHTHADASRKQLPEITCQSADCRHQAPSSNANGNNDASVAAIRKPSQGQAHERVEQAERQPVQQTELGIADVEIAAYRPHQQ